MTKPSASASKFPFLFYGHRPQEWAEGAQVWLLRFERAPTPDERASLGRMVAEAAFDGSCELEDFWFSAGAWAAASSDDDPDKTIFDAMGKLLRELHTVTPLSEVILATAKELGESPWDRWSMRTSPVPSALGPLVTPSGDHLVRLDAYYYGGDLNARCEASEPVPMVEDPGFAAAREEHFRGLFERSHAAALKKAARSSAPCLVPTLEAEAPPRLEGYAWTQRADTGRVVAISDAYPHHLVVRDPGVEPRTLDPGFELPSRLSLSPDGARALFVVRKEMIELDLDQGSHRVVFAHELGLTAFSAGYCGAADRVLTCYGDHTSLLERSADGATFEVTDSIEVSGVGLVVIRGRFGFLFDSRKTCIVGVGEGSLASLGSVRLKLRTRIHETTLDGAPRVFARQATGLTYEVMNLDKAWDKAFLPARRAKPAKKAAANKPLSVKLKLVQASAAPDPEHTERWRGCFEWARWIGETSSGRIVLRTRSGVAVVKDRKVVREVDLSEEGSFLMSSAQVHPVAERVLLVHGGERRLSVLDLDTGAARVLVSHQEIAERFGGTLGGAMIPAQGWVVVLQQDRLTLHREAEGGLSEPTSSMETEHWDMAPIRAGRACVLGGGGESQLVELELDEAGAPTGFRHAATFKMPGKKYKDHHADPVAVVGDALFLFTGDGCFSAQLR